MKHVFAVKLALVFAAICSGSAWASWNDVPVNSLFEQSEVVVHGTIIGTEPGPAELSSPWRSYQYLIIGIDESGVLKGDPGLEQVRILQPVPGFLSLSTDLYFDVGQQGAWLLSRSAAMQDEFSITHPSQYQPGGVVPPPPSISASAIVPEPGTLALLGAGLFLGLQRRRRS